jgi:hypothetical protein
MPVSDSTSRYAESARIRVPLPDGSVRDMLAPRVAPKTSANGAYQVKPGERLDLLSFVTTGDTTRWWLLADANPWMDATLVERPGETIELPDA